MKGGCLVESKFSERLTKALSVNKMKPVDLARKSGLSQSLISQYLSGKFEAKNDKIVIIAETLGISEKYLLGTSEDMFATNLNNLDNIFKVEKHRIPLLGSIACGEPIYADEDRESYVLAGTDIHADFCLKCKGDSMINARIYDGDIVFIRKQDIVDNGDIAAMLIDDSVTLKRFYYYRDQNMVILKPENPKHKDIVLVGEEIDRVRVLGKAIAFQSDVI